MKACAFRLGEQVFAGISRRDIEALYRVYRPRIDSLDHAMRRGAELGRSIVERATCSATSWVVRRRRMEVDVRSLKDFAPVNLVAEEVDVKVGAFVGERSVALDHLAGEVGKPVLARDEGGNSHAGIVA